MRAPIREEIAGDISRGDQREGKDGDLAGDRLRGLAVASTLGMVLERLRAKVTARDLAKAFDALAEQLNRNGGVYAQKLEWEELLSYSAVAILEWQGGPCGRCEGRGFVTTSEHKRIECPLCGGYGRMIFDEKRRARAAGKVLNRDDHLLLDYARTVLRDHDALAGRVVQHMVER